MKKILVVDDSKTLIQTFKQKFSTRMDVEVLYAKSYSDTMNLIRKQHNKIEVALLDINLPDAPNGEVISLVKAHHIPIIVLTGTLDENIRDKIQKKQIVNYILKNKPSSVDLAVQTVMNTFENSHKTVLIVDNVPTSVQMLQTIIKGMNLNVLTATDAKEALNILKTSDLYIPIVIVDYDIPQTNGLDLIIKIREKYSKDTLGIVAMSEDTQRDLIDDFLTFGANYFISKAFTEREVIAKINALLELIGLFQQIKEMANRDFLTGSFNRRYFFEVANRIFLKSARAKKALVVAMIDIDDFKKINDSYGHDIGDIAIKEVKNVLDKLLRKSDLMARFGGEEFCMIFENISLESTKQLLEKIRKAFETNSIRTKTVELTYTVSIGAVYGLGSSLDTLIKLSDNAMYEAKKNGKNQVKLHVLD